MRYLFILLGLLACGNDHVGWEDQWTDDQLLDIQSAVDDICLSMGPSWCERVDVTALGMVEGPYDVTGEHRFLGMAYPDTGMALVWPDEIAQENGTGVFQMVVTHELLHLLGCWEHHREYGVLGRFVDGGGITEADVAFCNSECSMYGSVC